MTFYFLLNIGYLRNVLLHQYMDDVLDVLHHTDKFDYQYELCEDDMQCLYEDIYKNRHDSRYQELSRWLDRKNKRIKYMTLDEFKTAEGKLNQLAERESKSARGVLRCPNVNKFDLHNTKVGFLKKSGLRNVLCDKNFVEVMSVLGLDIDNLDEFVTYIKNLFYNIIFDDEIKSSMEGLEAGFHIRKPEILEHLMIINSILPDILSIESDMSNVNISKKLNYLQCSPEKRRDIVKKYLTKTFDSEKKVNCELHTKMRRINNKAPDRIYFCANVPKGVKCRGMDISGKIYVYKISHHV